MKSNTHTSIALAWQEAVNQRDVVHLLALSDPHIEIVGPRGSAYGHDILRQWLERAGLHIEHHRLFAKGDEVVVAGHGVWRDIDTGALIGEADMASHFRVTDERVAYYARFDHLADALTAAHLTDADEQQGSL